MCEGVLEGLLVCVPICCKVRFVRMFVSKGIYKRRHLEEGH